MADPIILDVRVSSSSDDAEERASGTMYLTSTDLELVDDPTNNGPDQRVGLRFTGLDIPQGAVITNAYVQFTVDNTDSGAVALVIRGHDTDDAGTFTAAAGNVSSRPTTDASVAWSPEPWTTSGVAGLDQQTPDLAAVIQEIVDRPGWQSGNDLALIITGAGERTADSFDGAPGSAPLLHVEYTDPGGDPTNQPPVAVDDIAATDEDTASAPIPVLTNDDDPDGDPLTVTGVTDGANGSVINNGDGTLTYTPDPDFNGTDSFSYTVGDGNGGFDTATVNVTVNPINDAPVAVDDIAVTDEDTPSAPIPVLANDDDPDDDPLTITGVTDGANGTVTNNGDGTLTYAPNPAFSGADTFTYTVGDGNGGADIASVNVTVNPGSTPGPTVLDVRVSSGSDDAEEDASGAMYLTSTDLELVDDPTNNGPDQRVGLRFTGLDIPQGAVITNAYVQFTVDNTDSGSVALVIRGHDTDDAGTFTAAPGNVSGRTTTDASVAWSPEPWTISGVAGPDQQTPDLAAVIQEIVDRPGWQAGNDLALIITGAGERTADSFDGVPNNAPLLHVEFTDPGGDPTNQPPVAVDDIAATDEDAPSAPIPVLTNDDDPDGDPLTITGFTDGANGSVINNGDGTLTYTPDPDFNGTDNFTYTVGDGNGGFDIATVNVTVNPINDAPVAVDDIAVTDEDAPSAPIPVLTNDDDPDGDPLTITGVTDGTNGSVADNGDGTLTYTPNPGFNGTDSFSYTIGDGNGGADTASVSITVNPPPSGQVSFAAIGDYGDDSPGEQAVATLIASLDPDIVITTGDNSYDATPIDDNVGQYFSDYIGNYTGAYGPGSPTNRFFPSLGNHDWNDGGGLSAYLDYFTLPGNERYYDYVQGPVHFFVLDTDPQEPDGRTFDSVQGQWLQQGLAASTAPWQVVYMHHPPYSSGERHGSEPVMQWPFETWGADAVITGHDHTYERIVRDDNGDGTELPYFVTGLGGRSVRSFSTTDIVDGSQTRYADDFGTMLVVADSATITFQFYSIENGGTLVETYVLGGTLVADDSVVTDEDTPSAPIAVLANDAAGLIIVEHSVAANGTVSDNGDGTLTYTPNAGFVGEDSFSYTAQNGAGEVDSGIVSVTVNPSSDPGPTILDVRVAAGSDDAEERASGTMYLTSTDLELVDDPTNNGPDQRVGLRFTGLDIPQGAVITNAYVQFTVDNTDSGAVALVIRGHDTDDAGTFTAAAGNVSGRATTDAAVAWSPEPWTTSGVAGPDQQTPDLAAVIQEIVNRPGWQAGNDLALIITGSGERTADSFDGVPGNAPLLHVEFTEPAQGLALAQAGAPGDVIVGTDDPETLNGTDGNDTISGLRGDDILNGLAGDDSLLGGAGNDSLTGGPGADLFVLEDGGGFETVTDFRSGEGDALSLTDILAANPDAVVQLVEDGGDVEVLVDPDGAGPVEPTAVAVLLGAQVTLAELEDPVGSDIVLA